MRFEGGIQEVQFSNVLQQNWESGKVFDVEIEGTTHHDDMLCWAVDLGEGYTGIIPEQESGVEGFMGHLVGNRVYVKILNIDHEAKIAVLSRKSAVDFMRERLKLKPEDVISAVVKFVDNRHVYIDIGGGVIVPMNRRRATPSTRRMRDLFKPGETIKVQVVQTEPEIECDRVAVMPDQWENVQYRKNDYIAGIVVATKEGSALVEIKEGLVGIAPQPITYMVAYGQKVRCQVIKVLPDRKQMRLRIKGVVG